MFIEKPIHSSKAFLLGSHQESTKKKEKERRPGEGDKGDFNIGRKRVENHKQTGHSMTGNAEETKTTRQQGAQSRVEMEEVQLY